MATTITGIGKSKILTNLDTYNHTALATAIYTVKLRVDVIPPSGMTIVIKNNSTTIITSTTPVSGQNNIQVQAKVSCAAGDVIGVVITSSSGIEGQANEFKALLTMSQGLV